jgi:hypothetical protein
VIGRRWDVLPLAQARVVADGTPVAFLDQGQATLRDNLDSWGVDVTDPVQLFAYLVGQQHLVEHLFAAVGAGVAPPDALRHTRGAQLSRTAFLLPYLPAEARR